MKTYSRLTLAILLFTMVGCGTDGPLVEYYDNGQKKWEVHYRDGEPDGDGRWTERWTKWWVNGQKAVEEHYKDGEREGRSTEWHENGQKKHEFRFKNGEWDGLQLEWHENGQKRWEGHYKNDKQDGLETYWAKNGNTLSKMTCKDGLLISVESWLPDGSPCPFTKIVGEWGAVVKWRENGSKERQEHFKNGKRHGPFTAWYPDEHPNLWFTTKMVRSMVQKLNGTKTEKLLRPITTSKAKLYVRIMRYMIMSRLAMDFDPIDKWP